MCNHAVHQTKASKLINADLSLINEESGELNFSVLSRLMMGDTSKHEITQADKIFKLSKLCLETVEMFEGARDSSKNGHRKFKPDCDEIQVATQHFLEVVREMQGNVWQHYNKDKTKDRNIARVNMHLTEGAVIGRAPTADAVADLIADVEASVKSYWAQHPGVAEHFPEAIAVPGQADLPPRVEPGNDAAHYRQADDPEHVFNEMYISDNEDDAANDEAEEEKVNVGADTDPPAADAPVQPPKQKKRKKAVRKQVPAARQVEQHAEEDVAAAAQPERAAGQEAPASGPSASESLGSRAQARLRINNEWYEQIRQEQEQVEQGGGGGLRRSTRASAYRNPDFRLINLQADIINDN